ncbi:integrase, partial [Escherichia coli]|nr:integrase [Escherichia coli]
METVFDALKALKRASSQVVAASLGISREEAVNELWELKRNGVVDKTVNRPGFPGECFICELRLPDHYFRWKHNKLFLLLPEEYGPAFPAIVDCYTSPPTLVW